MCGGGFTMRIIKKVVVIAFVLAIILSIELGPLSASHSTFIGRSSAFAQGIGVDPEKHC
jgi:hypothetical protein